jgi:hypothetical protein
MRAGIGALAGWRHHKRIVSLLARSGGGDAAL